VERAFSRPLDEAVLTGAEGVEGASSGWALVREQADFVNRALTEMRYAS
jgi:hypothetical protein